MLDPLRTAHSNESPAGTDVWDPAVRAEESGYFWKGLPKLFRRDLRRNGAPLVVELFAGCGGTSKGFEMAGYQVGLGVDVHEPSAITFHENHRSASTIMGDVRLVTPEMIWSALGGRSPDVLIAGIPCQGFSLNNRKRHDGDERNFLFRTFLEFAEALQPRAIVVENVGGLLRTAGGAFAQAITEGLARAARLTVSHDLLLAAHHGVPQTRKRVVFVGVRGSRPFDFRAIERTHGIDGAPLLTVADAIGDLPELEAGEEAHVHARPAGTPFQRLMRAEAGDRLFNHRAPNHPSETIARIARTRPGEPMYPAFKQRIRLHWDQPSPTQVAGGIRPQFQFGHPGNARGLSIRERCRIQSFPDDFHVLGGTVQGRVQTGNAVPPLLAKAIAHGLLKVL